MVKRLGCVFLPPAPPAVLMTIAAVVIALVLTGVL